jgi:expansin (peptidoglycan-binding protein)
MRAYAAQGRCNSDPNARSVTIMITDCCPECEADHIDIQALTFNKMAPMALGRIDIKFRRSAKLPLLQSPLLNQHLFM